MKKINILFILFFFIPLKIYAQDAVNEEEFFSDSEGLFETKVKDLNAAEEEEKKSLTYSGEITGVNEVIKIKGEDDNFNSAYILGRFYLDGRLKRGTKYFGNFEVLNDSKVDETDITAKESFIDFNIKNSVYFRTGKQRLQWGRCFFWNPSDVINVEKNPFIEKIGSLEGTYGLKVHIPFGTKYNIYGFIDANDAQTTDDLGYAYKYEFIMENTEMAFSAWHKQGFQPVYAYDASTRFFGIDTLFEAAFSHGDNNDKVIEENGLLVRDREKGKWFPKISIDFGKQFDFMEVNDRIFINLELFYNSSGYDKDVLSDKTIFTFNQQGGLQTGTKKIFIFVNNLYEPNYFSKYYAALFTSVNKFIVSDMSLHLNLISNLNDNSHIVSAGVLYEDLSDFSIGLDTYIFLGRDDKEYTLTGNALTTRVLVGVEF